MWRVSSVEVAKLMAQGVRRHALVNLVMWAAVWQARVSGRGITPYLWVHPAEESEPPSQMRERANRNTAAQGRRLLTRGIHRTRSQDYAWYTCRTRCSCEFIKSFGIGFLRRSCGGSLATGFLRDTSAAKTMVRV